MICRLRDAERVEVRTPIAKQLAGNTTIDITQGEGSAETQALFFFCAYFSQCFMEVTFMYWKTKHDFHVKVAKAYMPMLKDENKTKYPKMYAFADKRWRHHVQRGLQILKDKNEQMKGL